ncbi:MAG TPA: branched-chain amino acid ABC transporter permease [Kofleriaceae bacterium]|nr:branched-chain amino acid ABC transporter permease [Kofleriaceae bacterium]
MPTRPLVTSYKDDLRLFPDMWHKVGLALGVAVVLYYPFYVGNEWLTVGNHALIAIVGAVSLMMLTGFSGQISLGHAAFLAIGAYTVALGGAAWHLPFWLLLPLGGLICAAVGLATGVFALRLKGLYLAIVTIGLLELVRHVLAWKVGGKSVGTSVPVYTWFGQSEASMDEFRVAMDYGPLTLWPGQKLYFIFLAIAVLVCWCAKNIHRTGAGRAMMAVRDHDLAAAALGVNPARAKILSFALSSFFAGIAGGMLAIAQETISVDPFYLDMSVEYIAIIVLGGIGTVFGAVTGAIAFVVIAPLLQKVGGFLPLISELSPALQETMLFSALVIGFLLVEPLGLLGVWLRIKRYFMAWPFRY